MLDKTFHVAWKMFYVSHISYQIVLIPDKDLTG